jgi:broad specificity phosphatase PhoE
VSATVTISRHAESQLSAGGVVNGDPAVHCPLNAAGRAQARALGARLQDVDLRLAVTSTFGRAVETAQLALSGRDVPMSTCPDLDDLRFGSFEGGPITSYRRWSSTHDAATPPPGGGESRRSAVLRYCTGLRRVLKEAGDGDVLVVAHGLPLAYVVAAATTGQLSDQVDPLPPGVECQVSAVDLAAALERLEPWARDGAT